MADTNKVKFGLSNVYYAIATIASDGTATYATPVAIPGAVSLTMSDAGSRNVFYADNIEYYVTSGAATRTGTLTVAKIPDAFHTAVFGMVTDSDGVMIDNANAQTVRFALLFEFSGDANKTRHVLYNCTASRPAVGSETTTETVTPVTEDLELSSTTIFDAVNEINTDHAKAPADSAAYDDWFTAVYQTEATITT